MVDMVYFYPKGHEAHSETGHPERPERIEVIRQAMQSTGWWDPYPQLSPIELSADFLVSVHTRAYLERLKTSCQRGIHLDIDTYTTPASWQLALNAAGGAAAVAQAVWQNRSKRGLALTRPPGHHATASCGMGFCLLNNVAIAAEYLLTQPGEGLPNAKHLAIVDLDLHHGNGTQEIFWERGDVLYISTHQWPLYPGSGRLDEIGAGPGEGCTANFPLPPGTGDLGFRAVMDQLILPLLDRFSPEILLVSVGFDSHWLDPLGSLMLSAAGFGELIKKLTAWADQKCSGKIALFLEGGYDLEAGAACILASVAALLDKTWQDPIGPSPRPEGKSWPTVVQRALDIWHLP